MGRSAAVKAIPMAGKTIAVLATLDTKGREADFLRKCIQDFGDRALLIDTGVVGSPQANADFTRDEVARAGGADLQSLLRDPSRSVAAPIMAEGATSLLLDLVRTERVHGVLSIGGTQGTTLSTRAMRALPYGFPKVMLSTMASGNVAPWVDIKDITMIFSVADILGLNRFSRRMLSNAAAAVCGMAELSAENLRGDRPLVAVTTVGITTRAAMNAVRIIEEAGYETIVFHAIGAGGRAMEQMMKEGIIGAVLDLATIEVSNEMFHAMLAGGPERLTVAGDLGLPQVICPGAIEVLVFGEPSTVPDPYRDRTLIRHSPQITDVRLNADEMAAVGREVAARLSHTRTDAVFLVPRGGFDSYAVAGQGFHDPAADAAFVDALKSDLPRNIRLVERNTHIEDEAFSAEAAQMLLAMLGDSDHAARTESWQRVTRGTTS
jgi:uncharacterized protein (UPF0261 family)